MSINRRLFYGYKSIDYMLLGIRLITGEVIMRGVTQCIVLIYRFVYKFMINK